MATSAQQRFNKYKADKLQKCVLLVRVAWAMCENVKMYYSSL